MSAGKMAITDRPAVPFFVTSQSNAQAPNGCIALRAVAELVRRNDREIQEQIQRNLQRSSKAAEQQLAAVNAPTEPLHTTSRMKRDELTALPAGRIV